MEERVEEKVDEKIDQELDKIEESLEKDKAEGKNTDSKSSSNEDKSQQRMMRMLKGMGVTGEPVPIADSYEFDHLIQMHIESYDVSGKKINEGEFITHLNPKTKSMAYEVVSGDMGDPGQGMFIIDAENGASIILSDKNNEKTGIVYGIGSLMETTSKNKLNGEKSIMKVTNVDKNSSVKFSMNDYKITNFGSFAPTEVE